MRFSWLAIFVLLFALAAPDVARACMPMPPPPQLEGETDAAYQQRLEALRVEAAAADIGRRAEWERQAFETAHAVLIARVERTGQTVRVDDYNQSPRPTLRPVRWLKGAGPARTFRVRYSEFTSCGPVGGGDAVTGAVGEQFLVFVREGRPHERAIMGTIALANIADDQLRALASAE